MHRHAYTGRKLSMSAAQRKALMRGQATALVLHETIQTTEAKARELVPYFERLVTKAKRGDLVGRRALEASLLNPNAVSKMVLELVPALSARSGGYTRITKLSPRRGDSAKMAAVSIILPDRKTPALPSATQTPEPSAEPTETKGATASKTARKPTVKKEAAK